MGYPNNPVHVLIGPWAIGFNGLDILDKWLIDFLMVEENELMWALYWAIKKEKLTNKDEEYVTDNGLGFMIRLIVDH